MTPRGGAGQALLQRLSLSLPPPPPLSLILPPLSRGRYCFNDSRVSPAGPGPPVDGTAYLLFYARVDPD